MTITNGVTTHCEEGQLGEDLLVITKGTVKTAGKICYSCHFCGSYDEKDHYALCVLRNGNEDRKFLIDGAVYSYSEAFLANEEDIGTKCWLSVCDIGETFGAAKRIS